jgi:two-component system LytT family response regulator
MSYRCVVIDDEKPARDRMKRLLAAHPEFALVGEAADADAAVRLIDETTPDLCFLDVQMPEGTGFDVLTRVRHVPFVIFVTAYDRYAVSAFEVRSIDYLLKPVSRQRFAQALERAREQIGHAGSARQLLDELDELRRSLAARPDGAPPRPDRLSVRRGSGVHLLDPDEIVWFEAEDTLVFARTATGRFLVDRTLSDLEHQFDRRFFRAHRGYLVNLARISEIRPADAGTFTIVCPDAGTVPLSRRQARLLREIFPW